MDEYYCPKCGATLNDQYGFDPDQGIWTCTECGAKLHRDYSIDPYEVVEQSNDYEEDDEEDVSNTYQERPFLLQSDSLVFCF